MCRIESPNHPPTRVSLFLDQLNFDALIYQMTGLSPSLTLWTEREWFQVAQLPFMPKVGLQLISPGMEVNTS